MQRQVPGLVALHLILRLLLRGRAVFAHKLNVLGVHLGDDTFNMPDIGVPTYVTVFLECKLETLPVRYEWRVK